MTQSIVVDYDLPHPPAKVWRALTTPALLARWLMENDIAPVVGHRFTMRAQPQGGWNGLVECEVLACDEPTLLRYSWKGSNLDSVVTWTLSPTATGTHLRLEHAGFTEQNGFAFDAMGKGWRGPIAERLAKVVASD
jgi:uncharacterized protein YndB with AHSA1/START domain